MWISQDYYEELLKTMEQFSQGSFEIDDYKLKSFNDQKYTKLTDAILRIRKAQKKRITRFDRLFNNIIEGSYEAIASEDIVENDFSMLYEKYNVLVRHLEKINRYINVAQKAITQNGKINSRIEDSELEGKWLNMVCNLNNILDSLSTPIDEITAVISNVAKGNLSQKMRLEINNFEISGDFLKLAKTINTMVDQLAQFASEVTRVAKEVGTEGILGGQAEVTGVSGTWLDLTNNVNGMADSLTAQVRNIADVTTAVAKGDLSQKITVDAKGEILELKGTINTMVDQLAQFASEVTRVAKEVGTEGILGGQAEVTGVSGTWLDLTNNVNGMADSLTAQVRNILNVAIAVANGDLTRVIDIDVKGELLELKNNMNTMIKVLSDSDTKNKNQNWIKDGVSILNKKVLDQDNLSTQVQTAITEISRYVGAGTGALYIFDSRKDTLRLEASYAYVKRNNLSNELKIGEGVVGQVAYEKKPILLTNVLDNLNISTGTTEYKALNTYTAPLIFKEELIGVIEIASYKPINDLHLEYFLSAFDTLSGSLYASLQSRSTENLLTQSQTQSKELEEQSIKLQEQNKVLEIQREKMDKQKRELEKKNKDLENAQIEITRAKELELANRYKSEFLANMSHELRTPLNSMLLLSNSLATSKKLDIEKVNKQASIIHDAGNSLLSLINDVLDLSKIEANLMSLNIEKVHCKALVEDLYGLFTPQAEEKNINLKTDISDDVADSFITDKVKLTQVLKNFISNAIKFTDEQGNIQIKIDKNDEHDIKQRPIKISIIDDGIGIEEDKIDLIFEAFRQADGSTSRKYGGTGLGLSISKEFVKLLGGRISVKSKPNEGSIFAVCLPEKIDTQNIDEELIDNVVINKTNADAKTPKQDIKTQAKPTPKPKHEQSEQTKTFISPVKSIVPDQINDGDSVIMVVDDDEAFSEIMKENVRNLGHKVIIAHDGNSAVALARDYKLKGILLDLVLPGLHGMEVLRVLKSDLNTRHIPIKIISFSDASTKMKKMGAVDFIQKPISAEVLDEAITSLVNFADNDKKHVLSLQNENSELADLISDKNVKVSIANSSQQGLEILKQYKDIDCIVIDKRLQKLDIASFLEQIKEKGYENPVVAYNKNDFTKQDFKKLEDLSQNIVLKIAVGDSELIEYISLFLHTKKESLDAVKQELLEKSLTEDSMLQNKKILMVDDDVRNIFALASVLEDKGIEVVTAQNGKEALDILEDEKNEFDMILMDIMMPVMDGYEAMRNIRKIDKLKNVPILSLTAKAQKEDKQKCLAAGANDYLTKPINHDRLLYLLKVWTKSV